MVSDWSRSYTFDTTARHTRIVPVFLSDWVYGLTTFAIVHSSLLFDSCLLSVSDRFDFVHSKARQICIAKALQSLLHSVLAYIISVTVNDYFNIIYSCVASF